MNQELVAPFVDAYRYLDCLNEYDRIISKYQNNTAQHTEKYRQLKERRARTAIKPILPFLYTSPFIFIFSAGLVAGTMEPVVRVILIALLLLCVITPFWISKMSKKAEKKENENFEREAVEYWQTVGGPAKSSNDEMIARIRSEKDQIIKQYSFVLDVVPPDYRNLAACGFIVTAMANQRAESLKEAVNLYEETLHRIRLENATKEMAYAIADMQSEVAYQMSAISAGIDKTNSKLKDIENLEFYNAFLKD